jgi:hypothetical protein
MKKHNFRSVIATASIVLGLSSIGPAHADAIGGHLGAVASATDVYAVTCPVGTVSVEASVNDAIASGTQVNVQLINPNGSAITASAVDGGGPSGFVTLNRTRRDWHRDAHADRSRVVTLLHRSARSCCAESHDSRDSPNRASPHAGGITARPLRVSVGPSSAAPMRRRAEAERSRHGALLFALQRVSDRSSVPGWNTQLR